MSLIDELIPINNSTQLIPSITPTPVELKTYKDIWSKLGIINIYHKGKILGNSGENKANVDEFLKKFTKFFEEYIRSELEKKNLTSEDLQPAFKVMFFNFNMIINYLKTKQINLNNNEFLALFNGFIDSYFETNIKS